MIKTTITDILRAAGIKNVGFCAFDSVKEHLLDCRAKQRIPQNTKTIIMCAFPYKVKEESPQFLSRYAAIPDYHTICGDMLAAACKKLKDNYPQNEFEYFCDNSPIPEVHTAAVSGLGVKGDNGLLITKDYGSFVFLGEILTDLEIECENSYKECIHCGKCKDSCPVKLNKLDCLSNLSQKKTLVDSELEILKDNNILWGCDICQNACPMNKNVKNTDIPEFINGYRNEYIIGENTENRPYTWRGENVIKRNYYNLTDLPQRKALRLKDYDYGTPGCYFITICTKNRQKILSKIVGVDAHIDPCEIKKIKLTNTGKIVDKYIKSSNDLNGINIDKYVIMPNHIHLIIKIKNGSMWASTPTKKISSVVCSIKTLTTKELGNSIFQRSFYDHVIRGEQDYKEIWQYIENNPAKWEEDEFYTE